MKNIARLLLVLFCATSLTTARAATILQDTQELRLQGTLDPTTRNGSSITLHGSWGYFFMDNVQAGGRIGFVNNDDVTSFDLGGYVEYNVDVGSEIVPFAEFFAGIANVDIDGTSGSDTAGIAELRAGAKYFLSEKLAIAAAGVFTYATEDIYPDKNKLRNTDAFIELSLRYYF
ncbi:MAG: outer membrane beta-barrel protein [Kiritimatiellae bacterium]|nr:outer membrane beta-barrel protein [Kiritimatiellia bacterium]